MAEVGVAASLLGIASFGIQLTTTLYNFGSTASSARQQTDYVARHVTLYSDVLELLAQKIDDDEPIHSRKALTLVDEIYDQSYDLFDKIRGLLPARSEKINIMQKIKWNFKKTKVDLLVAEIEYLKSTVNLSVSVLYASKRMRSYRRRGRPKKAENEINVQLARAQNAVVEQINATAIKADLQERVDAEEEEEDPIKGPISTGGPRVSAALIKHTAQMPELANSVAIVSFKQFMEQAKTVSEERGLVIENSKSLVNDLIDEWTTLANATTGVDSGATAPEGTPAADKGRGKANRVANADEKETTAELRRAQTLQDMFTRSQDRVEELEAELNRLRVDADIDREPNGQFTRQEPVLFKAKYLQISIGLRPCR